MYDRLHHKETCGAIFIVFGKDNLALGINDPERLYAMVVQSFSAYKSDPVQVVFFEENGYFGRENARFRVYEPVHNGLFLFHSILIIDKGRSTAHKDHDRT
jgi:hypothetical protein